MKGGKLHLLFGKKDADLVYWYRALPKGIAFDCIRKIINAERLKTTVAIPIPPEKGRKDTVAEMVIQVSDEALYKYIRTFAKSGINPNVKEILRKHIEWNYSQRQASFAEEVGLSISNPVSPAGDAAEDDGRADEASVPEEETFVADVVDDEEDGEEYMKMLRDLDDE